LTALQAFEDALPAQESEQASMKFDADGEPAPVEPLPEEQIQPASEQAAPEQAAPEQAAPTAPQLTATEPAGMAEPTAESEDDVSTRD
jgi:hypothetical protein